MKRHVIITASNRKCGNFLIDHWLVSLKKNVNLDQIDIVVVDYGLTKNQRKKIAAEKIILLEGKTGGNLMINRFIDAAKFLFKTDYDQVLVIDSGDVIFQKDIAHLFRKDKDRIRAYQYNTNPLYFDYFIKRNFLGRVREILWENLNNKAVFNSGVIVLPGNKLIELGKLIEKMGKNNKKFSSDQVLVNYFIYRNEYKTLSIDYNFTPGDKNGTFEIRNGKFVKKKGHVYAIVHNAGRTSTFRSINKFGYGKSYNKLSLTKYYFKKFFYWGTEVIKNGFYTARAKRAAEIYSLLRLKSSAKM